MSEPANKEQREAEDQAEREAAARASGSVKDDLTRKPHPISDAIEDLSPGDSVTAMDTETQIPVPSAPVPSPDRPDPAPSPDPSPAPQPPPGDPTPGPMAVLSGEPQRYE